MGDKKGGEAVVWIEWGSGLDVPSGTVTIRGHCALPYFILVFHT